jgi:cytochrome P450
MDLRRSDTLSTLWPSNVKSRGSYWQAYETTVNLIGNAILALFAEPSQLAALRDQPSMLPTAIEEFLRYESPINIATIRFTTFPIRVGDVDIPANEFVMIALLAANRDGGQFDDSDRLGIRQKT